MMKAVRRILGLALMVTILALSVTTSAFAFSSSASVTVNGVVLDSTNAYWKNGNAVASATDWNAHFDAATLTLTLKDAQMDTLSRKMGTGGTIAFVTTDSALNVVLEGTNQFTNTTPAMEPVSGISAPDTLHVSGNGTLQITLNYGSAMAVLYGLWCSNTITWESGNLSVYLVGGGNSYGISSIKGVTLKGGTIDIKTYGNMVMGVSCGTSILKVDGGKLDINAYGTRGVSYAISAGTVSLNGGTTTAFAQDGSVSFAVVYGDGGIALLGGTHNLAGQSGVFYDASWGAGAPLNRTGMYIYASESFDGTGLELWDAPTYTDLVARTAQNMPLHYAMVTSQLLPAKVLHTSAPKTGDQSTPWLWVGMLLAALLLAGGLVSQKRAIVKR